MLPRSSDQLRLQNLEKDENELFLQNFSKTSDYQRFQSKYGT